MTEKAKKLGNEPIDSTVFEDYSNDVQVLQFQRGLSKREYFSSMAMKGIITAGIPNGIGCSKQEYAAHWGVEYADALLEELSKTERSWNEN